MRNYFLLRSMEFSFHKTWSEEEKGTCTLNFFLSPENKIADKHNNS